MSYERTTPCGQIAGCGCQWPGVAAYKGIRYATAGRWEYPRPVTHWDGVYQATAYGAACFQPRSFYDEAQVPEKPSITTNSAKANTMTTAKTACF